MKKAPGPRQLPFLGAVPMLRRDPIGYLTQLTADYGDIVGFRLLNRPAFLLANPDYIREVLVTRQQNFGKTPTYHRMKRFFGEGLLTIEGEDHKRHRRLLQPAFHRERLQSYAAIVTAYTGQFRDRLTPGTEIDMHREMMRLSLRIVTRTLFDADVEGDAQDVGRAMTDLEQSFRMVSLPFARFLRRLPLPKYRRADNAVATVRRIVDRVIDERRNAAPTDDLLSTLLALRDEDGTRLSAIELRDEILTLFAAGNGATSLALTWTWYLLAKNPECEERMHRELDSALQGREPGFEDLALLPYTHGVVAESMRVRPPVWLLGRMAKESFELGDYRIPTGSICLMSPYLMHHDARYFPEPDRFDPDRWAPALRERRPKFSYFPFGGGSRICIGERFAIMQIVLVLATLAKKWRFRLVSSEPVKPRPQVTLKPSVRIRMIPEKGTHDF